MNISVEYSTATLLNNFANERTKTYNHEGLIDRIVRFGCYGTLLKFPKVPLIAITFFGQTVALHF